MRLLLAIALDFRAYREALRGVRAYLEEKRDRSAQFMLPGMPLDFVLEEWRPHAAITMYGAPLRPQAAVLLHRVHRVVNLLYAFPDLPCGAVCVEEELIGKMAAEYFLARGYRQLAYVGFPAEPWARHRAAAFEKHGRAGGASVRLIWPDSGPTDPWYSLGSGTEVQRWLRSLPTPVGLLACNDLRARQVADACLRWGIHVPEEVAILGVDDDDLFCGICHPALSSVAIGWYDMGARAAAMVTAPRFRPRVHTFGPTAVVTRQSTNVLTVEDPDILAALRFIEENAHRNIGTADVNRAVAVPRRTLERRFKRVLASTINAEITRIRLDRAKALLARADLSMPEVAERTGFQTGAKLAKVFRRELDETPMGYRRRLRSGRD